MTQSARLQNKELEAGKEVEVEYVHLDVDASGDKENVECSGSRGSREMS
jgi:hypothetical protein